MPGQLPYGRLNNPPAQPPGIGSVGVEYPVTWDQPPPAYTLSAQPQPSQVPHWNQTSNMMSGNSGGIPGYFPGPGYPASLNPAVPPMGFNPEVCPTAPDFSQMQKIPGYEKITSNEAIVPPSVPEYQPKIHERKQLENLPSLNEEEVREAALEFADDHCCYGSRAAKKMVLKDITMMSAFHYKLETFGEKRHTGWTFEPYKGQPIDGPMNGPAPQPWDIVVKPPAYFKNAKRKKEVPHTAYVKPCHTCVGNCRIRCEDCHGNGRTNCYLCSGRGSKCSICGGSGRRRCMNCSATGQVKCKTCDGLGQLKVFVQLTVTWTNHVGDYISETSSMPKELVREVTGQIAFEEENPRVSPFNASEASLRNVSKRLIQKHSSAFPSERILKQRHCLRLIPIGEVHYQWKEKEGKYYVYGYEHKAYFDSYPQKCCCCTIL